MPLQSSETRQILAPEGCEEASAIGVFLQIPLEVSAALQFCLEQDVLFALI